MLSLDFCLIKTVEIFKSYIHLTISFIYLFFINKFYQHLFKQFTDFW